MTAAALAGCALCMVGAMTLPGPGHLLNRLAGSPALAVAALSQQTGWQARQGAALEIGPWGRLFLDQSPLLKGVAQAQLSGEQEEAPVPGREQEEPVVPPPQGEVREYTGVGQPGKNMQSHGELYIQNTTGQEVDVAALSTQEASLHISMEEGPQILIYHTHGSEAYTQTEDSPYLESDSYRTTDLEKNVVRVGEEMAEVFRAQGFQVLHDTTLYDYPAYSGAYERSRAGVEHWLKEYPSIRFVLDVHRDALVSQDGAAYKLVAHEGTAKVAQVMLVVGCGSGEQSHPNWRENLTLAASLQRALLSRYEELARPITLRASRFNQHLSTGSLLVEVGGHGNTLEEAVEGGKLFARTVGAELRKRVE